MKCYHLHEGAGFFGEVVVALEAAVALTLTGIIITRSDHAVGMDCSSSHEDMSGRCMKPRSSFR